MANYTLSKPQRILSGCAVLIAVICFIGVGAASFVRWQTYFNFPIKLESGTAPKADGQEVTSGYKYGQEIHQASGSSIIQSGNTKIIMLPGAKLRINDSQIQPVDGYFYIVGGDFEIKEEKLSGISGLYSTAAHTLVITAGESSWRDTKLVFNKQLQFQPSVQLSNFNRQELTDPAWRELIPILTAKDMLPPSLQDTTPPTVSEILPLNGTQLTDGIIVFTGKVDDPHAQVFVNNQVATLDPNGRFTLSISIQPGSNKVVVIASDVWSNQSQIEVSYTQAPSAAVESNPTQQ